MVAIKLTCFTVVTAGFILNQINASYVDHESNYHENRHFNKNVSETIFVKNYDEFVVTSYNLDEFYQLANQSIEDLYGSAKGEKNVKISFYETNVEDINLNEEKKSEAYPKLTISDVSEYLNHSMELAKEQVQNALNSLQAVVIDQLQAEVHNYTTVLYECSKKHGIEHIPIETVCKLVPCLVEATKDAKSYLSDFIFLIKDTPALVRNMSSDISHCLDQFHNSTSLFRATKAAYCIAKAAAIKGGEATGLATEISYKSIEISRNILMLRSRATSCFEGKVVQVGKDLFNISGDVAKCIKDEMKKVFKAYFGIE